MKRAILSTLALLAVGCARQEQPAADTAAAATPTVAPAAAFPMAEAAGKWTYVAKNEAGDSTLVTAELTITADPAGWAILLPGRPSMPVRVTVSGDSVITATGPYESVLRKGVQVTTDGVLRMSGDKLVGTSTAHYTTTGPDSVRRLIVEATRKP